MQFVLGSKVFERLHSKAIYTVCVPQQVVPPDHWRFYPVQATRFALDRSDHNNGKRGLFLKTLDAVGLGFDS